ncbi:MAG: signal peptide peptidase SppA [Myxococcales bacterium]|jgi:protease-4|nr:signal peptide peptidase SppA [Myxococcales bacterium]
MDRRSATVLGIIFIGLFLALFAFVGLAFMAIDGGNESRGSFSRKKGGPAIGVIEINGAISKVDKLLAELRKFSADDNIKALVVRIDSPGGAVGPSQELYSELRDIAEKKAIPVVCSMGSVAASGGYYIAAGCQKIFANPGTLTGSIGVISQFPYLGDIANKLDFQMLTFKSGANKDIGNSFRKMTPEETALMQAMLDQVHEQFISDVAKGRNLEVEAVRPWADGRVLTGEEALKHKLIDEIGGLNAAIRYAAEQAELGDDPKLRYPAEEKPFDVLQFMSQGGEAMARGVVKGLTQTTTSTGSTAMIPAPAYLMTLPMGEVPNE